MNDEQDRQNNSGDGSRNMNSGMNACQGITLPVAGVEGADSMAMSGRLYGLQAGEAARTMRALAVAIALCAALTVGTARAEPHDASGPNTQVVTDRAGVAGSQPAEVPIPPSATRNMKASPLIAGRVISLTIVVAGVVLLAGSWRRGWDPEAAPDRQERSRMFSLVGVLLILYGLLQNGQYVPGGGDEAYYLSIGRAVAQTGEFIANGLPVVSAPYGWPYLIAAALKVSASFAFLNLLPLGLSVCSLALWYLVLRRVVDARTAFGAVIATAVLFHWQRCAFHFQSEPLYFALMAAAVLLSQQIGEGRRYWGARLAALVMMAAGLVLVRFAGVFTLPLLAAALLTSPGKPQMRQWISVAVIAVVLAVSIVGVRMMLKRGAHREVASMLMTLKQRDGEQAVADAQVAMSIRQTAERDIAAEGAVVNRAVGAGVSEYLRRLGSSGAWVSRLFWPPAEMGKGSGGIFVASNVAGWLLIALLLVCAADAVRRRAWLWVGGVLYCGVFVLVWPEPNGRYIAGGAPLLLLGAWQGAQGLAGRLAGTAWRKPAMVGSMALIASILLCNLPIYAMEVWVNQSADFNDKVLAGEHAELTSLCRYLNAHSLGNDELAVSPDKGYKQILRVAGLLTGRVVLASPVAGPPGAALLNWAQRNHVRYYVCRSENAPRRLWHVQLPSPRQDRDDPPCYVELYELRDGEAIRIHPRDKWVVDRVFGME